MTRVRAALAALLLAGAVLTGCTPTNADEQLVVVILPGEAGDSWARGGEVLRDELQHDGFRVELHQAGDDIPTQLAQLDEAIEQNPAVLVVAPIDATSLTNRLDRAGEAGIPVIAFDRLPQDTSAVDYVVTYDRVLAGRQQAWALLAGLGLTTRLGTPLAEPAEGPFSIELLAGSGDDPAAAARFQGAIEALSPYLTAGTLVVPSERVEFDQVAVLRAAPAEAAERVSALLADGIHVDGVLSPRDAMSRAVLKVLPATPTPVGGDATEVRPTIVTGGGAQLASIIAILEGAQYSTVLEDPRSLGVATARLVRQLARGTTAVVTPESVIDNGAIGVPAIFIDPVAVDARNVERTIIDSGYWTRAQLDG
jgi:putative multiple sugar transport system substrate-binding protein